MLMLAGFCLFAAMSQGPEAWLADPETYERDLRGALESYRQLAEDAADGEFGPRHGHRFLGVARLEGEPPEVTVIALPKTTWQ
jgi:hypothetical protein